MRALTLPIVASLAVGIWACQGPEPASIAPAAPAVAVVGQQPLATPTMAPTSAEVGPLPDEPPSRAVSQAPRVEQRLKSASVDEMLAGAADAPESLVPSAEPAVSGPPPVPSEDGSAEPCDRPPAPLPAPGTPGFADFWQAFRAPLPAAPVWDPPGPKRVGLQAGHWRVEEVPPELGRLGHGAVGGGKAEWEVNLEVARRAAALLEQAGVGVDILPATIPPRYRAHVFVSIHADGDERGVLRGYKLARPSFSATPEADDRLVGSLYDEYGLATTLPRDDEHITRRMTAYYAFNSRRYCHAVAPGVPSAILEMGFLTNATDRQVLIGDPDRAARGLAQGVLRYLGMKDEG